jgi:hypothetical protein
LSGQLEYQQTKCCGFAAVECFSFACKNSKIEKPGWIVVVSQLLGVGGVKQAFSTKVITRFSKLAAGIPSGWQFFRPDRTCPTVGKTMFHASNSLVRQGRFGPFEPFAMASIFGSSGGNDDLDVSE